MPLLPKALILFVVGAIAGIINALAGGGTLVSFPTLILLGLPSIIANATNTVAMQFGTMASMWSYRQEFARQKQWAWRFGPVSALGGLLGAILLLHTREAAFRAIVPYLLLFATVLFAFQPVVSRWLQIEAGAIQKSSNALLWALVFQFFVALYGGYFGAGMGILMLAALGILGQTDIHEMNALKVLLATLINGFAAVYFIAKGSVTWLDCILLTAGALAGGYFGPVMARRIGRPAVRAFVTAVGFGLGIYFLIK